MPTNTSHHHNAPRHQPLCVFVFDAAATEVSSQNSKPDSRTDMHQAGVLSSSPLSPGAGGAADPLSLSSSQNRLRQRLGSEYARQMSVISYDEHGLEDVVEVSVWLARSW